MAVFLAIVVTFLLTYILTVFGTMFFVHWYMERNKPFRNYWRDTINEYSGYNEIEP